MKPSEPLKYNYKYKKNAVSALFVFFSSEQSWRNVVVEDFKRTQEWVKHIKDLSDTHFPNMRKIHIVLDSFKTHNPVKFYEYFNPQTARRLIEKFEFHFTPKHASWLNMTEIEFSVLFGQALNRRIPNQETIPYNSWNKEHLFMSGVVLELIIVPTAFIKNYHLTICLRVFAYDVNPR